MNIRTIVKNLLRVLLLWLGAVGSIASIYAIRKEIVQGASSLNVATFKSILVAPAVYLPSAGALPLVVLGFSLYRNLRVRGGISVRAFGRRFDPFLHTRIIYETHGLQHVCCQIRRYVKPRRARGPALVGEEEFRTLVFEFLKQSKVMLDLATGADVAVNVKLFEHKTNGATGNIPIQSAVLRTWLRVPSSRELTLRESGQLRARENDEVFKIMSGTKGHPGRMIAKAEELKRGRKRVNSGYNHVFGGTEHYFICNDLLRAQAKGTFFSTSHEYEKYYNSVAVFLVNANLPCGAPVDHHPVWGLLVIDSYDTKRFEVSIVRSLGGYMAHRLYELLDQLN